MKEYVVIHQYSDKYTKEYHPKGAKVKLTDERAKELKGFVEVQKPDKK